jgi:hypothetical protein
MCSVFRLSMIALLPMLPLIVFHPIVSAAATAAARSHRERRAMRIQQWSALLLVSALFVSSPGSVEAQARGQGRQGMSGMMQMQHGMMGGCIMNDLPTPGAVLGHAQQLHLSSSQKSRLTELNATVTTAQTRHRADHDALQQQAARLLAVAKPDFAAYQVVLEKLVAMMVPFHMTVVRASVAARDLLTPEQKAKWEELRKTTAAMPCMSN